MIVTGKQQEHQHYHLEKNDKYEYLTGEEILPPNQRQIIEKGRFASSPLGKSLKKNRKTE